MRTSMSTSTTNVTVAMLAMSVVCCSAQSYRNSATGQTYNNSYSAMLSTTSTMMQQFNNQQFRYLNSTQRAAGSFTAAAAAPQSPITGTDFPLTPWRTVPVQMVQEMPANVPVQQRQAMLRLYEQFLTEYEKTNRRGNLAAATAYTIRVSLEIERGRKLTMAESEALIQYLNNSMLADPNFYGLSAQQKQVFYETTILNGGVAAALYVEGRLQNNAGYQQQAHEIAQSVLRQAGL